MYSIITVILSITLTVKIKTTFQIQFGALCLHIVKYYVCVCVYSGGSLIVGGFQLLFTICFFYLMLDYFFNTTTKDVLLKLLNA